MIRELIKQSTLQAVQTLWPDVAIDEVVLERPSRPEFGDYAVSVAFQVAKQIKHETQTVAKQLLQVMLRDKPSEIDKIEIAGHGYLNFFVATDFLQQELGRIAADAHYGRSQQGQGQTVIVEYPSTNIAKPMHYGHSRTAFIGDALSNIYEFLGYTVIRWDYLGDWGTSFGKLIAAYKLWGDKNAVEQAPLATLLELYVRFTTETATHPEFEALARSEFNKLEQGDQHNLELWQWFKSESLKETERMYRLLKLNTFDVTIGESFFEKDMKPLVGELLHKGIAKRSEGAVIVPLDDQLDSAQSKHGLPPALLEKSDGASLYLTRDIANLRYRLETYKPTKILYVVANQQALHFEQLFAIARILGLTQAELVHVKYGLVLNQARKKLATREGKAVQLKDVIEEAIKRASAIVAEKNPQLSEDEQKTIAQTVAIGALKYNDLKEYRTSDIIFDWQKILDFSGNSGPYLQYTYARLMSIVAKVPDAVPTDSVRFDKLQEPTELAIIKQLLEFTQVLTESGLAYAPSYLALYLYELATRANNFYEHVRILDDNNSERLQARLQLISTTARVLKQGLTLLGIEVLATI